MFDFIKYVFNARIRNENDKFILVFNILGFLLEIGVQVQNLSMWKQKLIFIRILTSNFLFYR